MVVIGLGNELMADDGVGVHAVRRLGRILPANIPCVEIGTATLKAQTLCEEADLVVAIDAVQAGGRPGSVYVFDPTDAVLPGADSLHDLSLAGLMRMIPPDQRPRALVVGVEPARLDYALSLSPPVEAALPDVIETVCQLVASGGQVTPSLPTTGRRVRDIAHIEEIP